MAMFRFENNYAAPTRQQRERYMRGEVEEHHFGPDGEITLLLYPEAAYLKDDIDGVRILFTGVREKPHAVEEARRMVEYHQLMEDSETHSQQGIPLIKPDNDPHGGDACMGTHILKNNLPGD